MLFTNLLNRSKNAHALASVRQFVIFCMESFSYPPHDNSTDCRLPWNACANAGVCSDRDGWCDCTANYDPLMACATPYHHALEFGSKMTVVIVGVILYAAMSLLFVTELVHVTVLHRTARTWRNPSTWALCLSCMFLALRLVALALNAADFTRADTTLGVIALLINTVGISTFGCVSVLCFIGWLGILQRTRNLGTLSPGFQRCRIASTVLMCLGVPTGILFAVLGGLGVGPPGLFALASQMCAAIGVGVPTVIAIGCLIAVTPFLRQVSDNLKGTDKTTTTTSVKRDHYVFSILMAKTKLMIALVLLMVITFAWVFGIAFSLDGGLPAVVLLKLYAQVVTDTMIVPVFWLFAQKHFAGPRRRRHGMASYFLVCLKPEDPTSETPMTTATTSGKTPSTDSTTAAAATPKPTPTVPPLLL